MFERVSPAVRPVGASGDPPAASAADKAAARRGASTHGLHPVSATRYDISGEGGTLLKGTHIANDHADHANDHATVCAGHVMRAGRHAAEFTVLGSGLVRQKTSIYWACAPADRCGATRCAWHGPFLGDVLWRRRNKPQR
jgi:hypothetical protein